MFYKLLMHPDPKQFEAAATALLAAGYEPASGVIVNTMIVRQNALTGQNEAAQVFTQSFIGEVELEEPKSDRSSSPLITA